MPTVDPYGVPISYILSNIIVAIFVGYEVFLDHKAIFTTVTDRPPVAGFYF